MKIMDKTVLYVTGNEFTYVQAYLRGGLVMSQNIRLELENPKIIAIDDKGNDVKVELEDLEGTILYSNKFINKKENLMFKGKNLYFVLTFDSKSVFTSKSLIADDDYRTLRIVDNFEIPKIRRNEL